MKGFLLRPVSVAEENPSGLILSVGMVVFVLAVCRG